MAIDRARLLCDEKQWLPDSNVLSDSHIRSINETVITNVGDEDNNYAEILCKGLRAIGLANRAKQQVDDRGLKREEAGEVEYEYYLEGSNDPWSLFIKSLSDICPLFGYTGLNAGIGIKITPSVRPVVNPCPTLSEEDEDRLIL